jgi:hypothetical protein
MRPDLTNAAAFLVAGVAACGTSIIEGDAETDDEGVEVSDVSLDGDDLLDMTVEEMPVPTEWRTFRSVCGSSSHDVHVFGMGAGWYFGVNALDYDGESWRPVDASSIVPPSDFWDGFMNDCGASRSGGVFAVGYGPSHPMFPPPPVEYAWHYDGDLWWVSIEIDSYDDPPHCYSGLHALNGVWSLSPSSTWAVGNGWAGVDGYVAFMLRFDGSAWTCRGQVVGPELMSIWAGSDEEVFAVGREGTIVRLVSDEWVQMDSPVFYYEDLLGVWGRSPSDLYAVGTEGTIIRYDGDAWSTMESGTSETLNSVWGSEAGSVFAVGMNGTILSLHDGVWVAEVSGTNADLWDVWGSSADDVYAVGGENESSPTPGRGVILHFEGSTWTEIEN